MSVPSPFPELSAGRRTVLAAAAALPLLAGCAVDTPTIELPGRDDADDPAVREAARLTRAMIGRLEDAATRHPGLTSSLAGVLSMHRSHLRALDDDAATPDAPAANGGHDRAGTLASLARREQRTGQRLVALAQQARSGDLALLLGSMAAAVAQRLDGWPPGGRR